MDNMKYYKESLAYDFDMFMPKAQPQTREKDNVIKLPKANVKRNAKRKSAAKQVSVSLFAVMTAFFVLAALCGNIYMRIRINEVNSMINDVQEEINTLSGEATSLEMELERRITYSNIELEATEMGMHKMDKSQVKYIRVNDKNTAVCDDGRIIAEKAEE